MQTLLPFLLNNWKPILACLAVLAFAAFMIWFGYGEGVKAEHARGVVSLAAQIKSDTEKCNQNKYITEEADREIQAKLSDVRRQLANLKRVHPNRCVAIAPVSPSGDNGTAQNSQLPQPYGINANDLYDFAGDAEEVGVQLDACQAFVRAERR